MACSPTIHGIIAWVAPTWNTPTSYTGHPLQHPGRSLEEWPWSSWCKDTTVPLVMWHVWWWSLLWYIITTRRTGLDMNFIFCRIYCMKTSLTMPRSDWSILALRKWSQPIVAWGRHALRCSMPHRKCCVMRWNRPVRWLLMIMMNRVICGASALYWCVSLLIIFRMRHSRDEMYIGHGRLCFCMSVCLSLAAFPHYCTDPDVTWGMAGGTL